MGGTRTALTIAGSDSGGGAGIQADLKAFARCGVHGTTAITAITAQSTVGVSAIEPVAPEMVLAQVRAVLSDIAVDAVKVGMLATAPVAQAVAQALGELSAGTLVVVDPVMVAESGARLLDDDAQRVLIEQILPGASVITPNLLEARALVESSVQAGAKVDARAGGGEDEEVLALARQLLALGPGAVVVTGGHRERAVDLFLGRGGEQGPIEIEGDRHPDGAAHGSGCTHSSVLAAQLALGQKPLQAARTARAMTGEAVEHGLRDVGAGAGPVDVLNLKSWRGRPRR